MMRKNELVYANPVSGWQRVKCGGLPRSFCHFGLIPVSLKLLVLLSLAVSVNGSVRESIPVRADLPSFLGHPRLNASQPKATISRDRLSLENGFLLLDLDLSGRLPARATITNKISGRSYALGLLNPSFATSTKTLGEAFKLVGTQIRNDGESSRALVNIRNSALELTITFELSRGDHFIHQKVEVKNVGAQLISLQEVSPERLVFDPRQFSSVDIKSTKLTDVVAYLNDPKGEGLFLTLDFPYCEIKRRTTDRIDLGYPPYAVVNTGESFQAHDVVLGVFTAPSAENPDSGRQFSFLRWVTRTHLPRINEPQLHFYHINNDMYDRRARLYYSYRNPEMGSYMRNLDATKIMLNLAEDLGFNSYQGMEEPFAFVEGVNPDPREWSQIRRLTEEGGIRLGAGPISNQGILTPMNNPFLKQFSYATGAVDPNSSFYKWVIRNSAGQVAGDEPGFCLGSDSFTKYFEDELVRLAHLYGFNWYNFDVLKVEECFDASHGHPRGGNGSLYRQILNLTRVLENVHRRVPGLLWDTNLGFVPLHPKIVKYVDGIYPTDPYGSEDIISLNRNLVYDEARRSRYTEAFTENGMPPVFFRQCLYFLSDNSIVRNAKTFEYEVLLNFAMGPNLAVGHLWSELQELPYEESQQSRGFLKGWMEWAKRNYDLLSVTRYIGSGKNGGHIYSHIKGDRGYIFLVNPNYWTAQFNLPLDQRIGLWDGDRFTLKELYPRSRNILTNRLPYPNWKDVVTLDAAPLTIRVIEIGPTSELWGPLLLGPEGTVTPDGKGNYRVTTIGPQGEEEDFAILLPGAEKAVSLTYSEPPVVVVNTEKQLKQSPGELLSSNLKTRFVRGRIRYPRNPVQPELMKWSIRTEPLDGGLKNGLNKGFGGKDLVFTGQAADGAPGGFGGAYLENIFNEKQELLLDLIVEQNQSTSSEGEILATPSEDITTRGKEQKEPREVWYSTRVSLPFVQEEDLRPAPNKHLYLLLLLHRFKDIEEPRVWINGKEAPVRFYEYARVAAGSFYVDGTDAGLHNDDNVIVVYLKRK